MKLSDNYKEKNQEEFDDDGFLPENQEYAETMTSPQEDVEKYPRKYIIEECIPACIELWKKNIYTFMVSDHLNKGQCWIEIIFDNLSQENKDIFMNLEGEDIIKYSYHPGTVNFGVNCVGKEGQEKLLSIAKEFKMQDVPLTFGYIPIEDFLFEYCDCYDEMSNPEYVEMKTPAEANLSEDELYDYIDRYYNWMDSISSKKTIKVFNPSKASKPIQDLVKDHNMIYEDGRVYLSEFHYKKHINYINYLNNLNQKSKKN